MSDNNHSKEQESNDSKPVASSSTGEPERVDPARKEKLIQMLEKLHLQTGEPLPASVMDALKKGTKLEKAKVHEFWKTQPVPQGELNTEVVPKAFEDDLPIEKVRNMPIALPGDFEWVDVDLDDEEQLLQLYNLLTANYNEDADGMFRFDYSTDFLKWALKPPGYRKNWNVGVRVKATKKLVAFISGIPIQLQVLESVKPMLEVNFLCNHKKLRSKRLAPVLIKELTRRAHLEGIFQAVFTAGIRIPTPLAVCPYYHRTIRPKKLVEVGFSGLRGQTMAQRVRKDALPTKPTLDLKLMQPHHIPQIRALFNQFQVTNTKLTPLMTSDELTQHWLLPVNQVLWTYVVETLDENVSDYVSFYRLDSTVLRHSAYDKIDVAYLYYYGTTQKDEEGKVCKKRLKELINSALIMAKQIGFDLLNAMDVNQGISVFTDLGFSKGDGSLHYYLYNWQCPPLNNGDIGLVMV